MKIRMKGLVLGIAAGLWAGSAGPPVQAGDVNVNINIGPPPVVVMAAPPTMLFLAEPGIFVAVGAPYDIFFFDARYYYFHAGYWFWGPGYNGPWILVQVHLLPPGLQKYKIEKIRLFRDREFKVYKAQGPKYKGRRFVGVQGPGPRADQPVKGPKMKEGRGKGRGPK